MIFSNFSVEDNLWDDNFESGTEKYISSASDSDVRVYNANDVPIRARKRVANMKSSNDGPSAKKSRGYSASRRALVNIENDLKASIEHAFEDVNEMTDNLQKKLDEANAEKQTLVQKNLALVEEKKELEQTIAELQLNKAKMTCTNCQAALDSVLFCNKECAK